jgi:hypothetical protein
VRPDRRDCLEEDQQASPAIGGRVRRFRRVASSGRTPSHGCSGA